MSRLTILLISAILLLSACLRPQDIYLFSYFTGNGEDGLHLAYSTDGLAWTALKEGKSFLSPSVGNDKLMRDPCIIKGHDGLFHMVWTSGWWDKHIGYASSPDLMHWSQQKAIPVMEHEPEARNCWAPEIFYDNNNKEYLIFWSTTIPGRHSEVATSEREKGLNHRIYYVTTSDFNKFSETNMFFNPDFSVIDATITEKDKKFYMIVKNENSNPPEKNLRVTSSSNAQGPYPVEVSVPITGNYWAEGPTCLQVGEYMHVYFDKYRDHQYGAIRSKDMKHWEDISDQVSFPQGIRHGTAFKVSERVYERLLENP
ncbi:MAG: glycoside hydrolase family 43 protein [Bacteroidales bacterium]|nr:glycoside hydrolase family 43 protein [Bacteroidales bacterium]